MRVLAITMVFVALNSIGFVYRTIVHRHEAAATNASSTTMTPIVPVMTIRPPVAPPPVKPAPITTPPVTEPTISSPVDPQSSQTAKSEIPRTTPPTPHPTNVTKVGEQRKPPTVMRPAMGVRPPVPARVPPHAPAPEHVPAPDSDPAPVAVKPPNKPDATPRTEDSLQKIEANPYKRGE